MKRLQEAAGRGRRPRRWRKARDAVFPGPFIAPGRSVGAAASRASPAPSRCWRWARGSRRRGGAAPAPPPGTSGPRCWRGSRGWTGRCSARRHTLRRGGAEVTAARYSRGPGRPPLALRGAGRPPRLSPPPPRGRGCRRAGLTVGHLGAVDGVEAAASRRPDRAAAVGLQDSEGRVLARPPLPGAAGELPSEGKRCKPGGEGPGACRGAEQQTPPARLPLDSAFPVSRRLTLLLRRPKLGLGERRAPRGWGACWMPSGSVTVPPYIPGKPMYMLSVKSEKGFVLTQTVRLLLTSGCIRPVPDP